MDERVIDQLIESLGDSDDAIEKLEVLGEPAFQRFFEVAERLVEVPFGADPRDASVNRALALGRLGKRYPELFFELVKGTEFFKFETIQALGYKGDERLKAIAKAALKTFGNDR